MHPEQTEEALYMEYAETGPIDNPQIWESYQALRAGIQHLSREEQVRILELAADLANAQERAAFLAGFRIRQEHP